MKKFMGNDFLLTTDTAKALYHQIAADLPIIDYHCHVPPKDIAENKQFANLTELWLGGTTTSGVLCGAVVWTKNTSPETLQTTKSS